MEWVKEMTIRVETHGSEPAVGIKLKLVEIVNTTHEHHTLSYCPLFSYSIFLLFIVLWGQ